MRIILSILGGRLFRGIYEFFTNVSKINLKDYYNHAFEIFRPNIRKIFEKELMAVHAVGIMFRYALGS